MHTLKFYIQRGEEYHSTSVFNLSCAFGTHIATGFFTENPAGKRLSQIPSILLYQADDEELVKTKNLQYYYLLTSTETIDFLKKFQDAQKRYPETPRKGKVAKAAFYRLKKSREGLIKGLIALLKHTKYNVVAEVF